MGIFQLKFKAIEGVDVNKIISKDKSIKEIFSKRIDNYQSSLGVNGTPAPGISFLKVQADTKINSYTYKTEDGKKRLIVERESITYVDESEYRGWSSFKCDLVECIKLLIGQIEPCEVERLSVRFVNKFTFDSFDDPLEYFTKTISTSTDKMKYPLKKYAFRMFLDVKDHTWAVINHSLEPLENTIDYMFDIDVLSSTKIIMKMDAIADELEALHKIRNEIFFDALTEKTIELCN